MQTDRETLQWGSYCTLDCTRTIDIVPTISYPYSFTLGVTPTPATPALPVPLMMGNPYP